MSPLLIDEFQELTKLTYTLLLKFWTNIHKLTQMFQIFYFENLWWMKFLHKWCFIIIVNITSPNFCQIKYVVPKKII